MNKNLFKLLTFYFRNTELCCPIDREAIDLNKVFFSLFVKYDNLY